MSQMTDVEHVASGEILWKRATNATRYDSCNLDVDL